MTRCHGVIFPDTSGFNSVFWWRTLRRAPLSPGSPNWHLIVWELTRPCLTRIVMEECNLSTDRRLSRHPSLAFVCSSQAWRSLPSHSSLLVIKKPSCSSAQNWKLKILTRWHEGATLAFFRDKLSFWVSLSQVLSVYFSIFWHQGFLLNQFTWVFGYFEMIKDAANKCTASHTEMYFG